MPAFYRLDLPAPDLARHFAASAGADPWPGGAVSPGGFAPVITTGREFIAGPRPQSHLAGQPTRRIVPRLWGVPPPQSAGDPGRGVLTVRNPDSPFWVGNLRNSEFRCLVPATGFAEWGREGARDGKRRRCLVTTEQPLFAMAGVWKDSEVPSFAIVTCEANALLRAEGRETMPVILPADPAAHHAWLNGGWDRAQALIAPYPSALMRIGD